jgi:hypothetical protein
MSKRRWDPPTTGPNVPNYEPLPEAQQPAPKGKILIDQPVVMGRPAEMQIDLLQPQPKTNNWPAMNGGKK